ncbi:sugar O-acetyltransferase [Bauldia sp.]|uniref:sugar O-acetyltransferase n=1 Tax=Bauldia sp. TaxID=2575872 RepID=UPI003BAC2F5C
MNEPRRQFDRMIAGMPYRAPDAEIMALQSEAAQKYLRVNATEGDADPTERLHLLRDAMGAFGESFLNPPVRWEYGRHVFVGDSCLINTNCLFMDGAEIRIGSFTLIGPNCSLLTAGHPVVPEERIRTNPTTGALDHAIAMNAPISIGSHCWIGAGSIVLGGVTIGDGTTVGAGSVVARSLPARVVAVGNPARIVRELPPPAQTGGNAGETMEPVR